MPTDGRSTDPRASLPAAIAAVAGADDLDSSLDAVLAAAVDALHPAMAAIFIADPDRAGLQLIASHGLDDASRERLSAEVEDPSHPFTAAALGRVATFDREGHRVRRSSFVGAYLPLVVSSGGVDVTLGSVGMGWPAPRDLDEPERETISALAALAAIAMDRSRLASTAAERSEWFERMAHTDPLTGLANERTVGADPGAGARPGRAARAASCRSRCSTSTTSSPRTATAVPRPATTSCVRWRPSWPSRSGWSTPSGGSAATSSSWSRRGLPGATVARRVLDGIAALPAVAGKQMSVSAGVARFPVDGSDADDAHRGRDGRARPGPGIAGRGFVAETGVAAEG